jgi:hypothetical protein
MNPATRADWKAAEMPESTTHLDVRRVFTRDDFARLCFGVVPNTMEDKWFVYFESPWLYIHRSWTGLCIYKVRFALSSSGVEIADVIANRDAGQYGEPNTSADAQRLLTLLESVVRRNYRYADARGLSGSSDLLP